MNDAQSLDGELMEAVLIELVRSGTLLPDIMERVAESFDVEERYHVGSDRQDRYATLANMARSILLAAASPTAEEFRAAQVKRAMPHIPAKAPKQDR